VHSTPYDSIPFRRQEPPVVSLTQQFYPTILLAPAAADRGALLSLTFTNDKFIHAVTWSPVPPAHCQLEELRFCSFSRLLSCGPASEVRPLWSFVRETGAGLEIYFTLIRRRSRLPFAIEVELFDLFGPRIDWLIDWWTDSLEQ